MEKKVINSFGSIVIPANIRHEMGIDGNMMLNVGIRELPNGEKEIFIKRPSEAEDILNRYRTWSEAISRVAESSIAIIWNDKLLSISSSVTTESFIGKRALLNPSLRRYFELYPNGAVIDPSESPSLLRTGPGVVSAFYKIKSIDDIPTYFIVVKGSKKDKTLSRAEEKKRYQIIKDIVEKI